MSILIKGMKMPKNCDECFFIGRGYPDWCSLPQIPNGEDGIDDTKKRPDWCPLIELPEKHGRLVDRDAIMKKLDIAEDCTNCIYQVGSLCGRSNSFVDACETICDAPTIIEAEGDEG